ncbi:AAA family ATPase [Agromyces sp. G08B096]|uniref:AAA family ATPase n=1 Tax=Agromyces sp. G08B096 TaxID=3156399 RepID=A0AAU7W6W5_9MICO
MSGQGTGSLTVPATATMTASATGTPDGAQTERSPESGTAPATSADVGGSWHDDWVTTSVSSPAMVGRQADLAWLEGLLEEARQGAPRTVVLGGEAGIGKTRLFREFIGRLGPDVRLLFGQSVDLGDVAAPYAPVKAALRTLVAEIGAEAVLDAVGPGRPALIALLPELADADAAPASAQAGGAAAAGQLHEAIAVLLETVSRDRPTVLAIEDLHWIDVASLALLRFLMRALTSSRVLIVLTYRTEDIGRGHPVRGFLTEIERDRWVQRRELSRLTRAQVRKMARMLISDTPTDATIDSVYRRSEGVPFFVEELIGIDGCRDDTALPDTLRDLLLVRYERLPERAQHVLRLLSIGGVRVSHTLLASVYQGDPDDLDVALREAVLAGVLTVDRDDYAFRHALVREAIVADLLPGERGRFHARYAEAYEAMSASGTRRLAAEISFHWLGAHDAVRAFPATIQAMREARASAAYATAAQLGERAISLWEVVPGAERMAGMGKIELMGRTASHLRNAGESERALALVKAALEECPGDDPQVPRLLRDQALVLANLGRPGATQLLERALEHLGDRDDPASLDLRATVLTTLAGRQMVSGAKTDSLETAREALAIALQVGAARSASVAKNIESISRAIRGEVEEALAGLEEARELARGDGSALLRYWVNASDLHYLIGSHRQAVRLAEEGLERSREQGVERSSGVILASNAVDPLLALGEWERADELIDRALALDPSAQFTVYLHRARIWSLLWRGRLEEAAAVFAAVRPLMMPLMELELQTRMSVGRVAAELALESGDLAEAWRRVAPIFEERLPLSPGYTLPYLWVGARVLAATEASIDETPAVADARHEAERLRAVLNGLPAWPTTPLWTAFFEAELTEFTEPSERIRAWQAAERATEVPESHVFLAPYARFRLAEAEIAAGDRVAARASLRAAGDLAERTGVGLVASHVERVARAAGLAGGGSPAPAVPPTGGGEASADPSLVELTARERQVLDLIAEGLSNKQIGERLFISGKTASVHVSAILRKLGAATRTEAAVRAGALR